MCTQLPRTLGTLITINSTFSTFRLHQKYQKITEFTFQANYKYNWVKCSIFPCKVSYVIDPKEFIFAIEIRI